MKKDSISSFKRKNKKKIKIKLKFKIDWIHSYCSKYTRG